MYRFGGVNRFVMRARAAKARLSPICCGDHRLVSADPFPLTGTFGRVLRKSPASVRGTLRVCVAMAPCRRSCAAGQHFTQVGWKPTCERSLRDQPEGAALPKVSKWLPCAEQAALAQRFGG
jgi:hypothetical protein